MGNAYLLGYNIGLTVAWSLILFKTIIVSFVEGGASGDVYQGVKPLLRIAQTAALLEIVHSALGLVRSPVHVTATQVASRIWIVWGILELVPGPTVNGSVPLGTVAGTKFQLNLVSLLIAWSLSEVNRYSFFAIKDIVGFVPYPNLWLRYSGFIVLYPLGVASELALAYLALPEIKSRGLLSLKMPNQINFSVDYHVVCILVMLAYAPGLPKLYGYMLSQRKKQLGGSAAKKSKAL